ncbi:hypothetical protein [Zymomonas mobilis]|uniref:hypothetical protein n=1 Tax=Zymomonas mobilis TaxID=542 RepID=UPI001154E51A|nr:hypothetical protein [Zymomonas mobilis]
MNLREKFKLAVLSANGSKFEELFTKIQSYLHADFEQVKPHGNIGDHGNDGWLKNSGTYF